MQGMNAQARNDLIPIDLEWTDSETGDLWLHVSMTQPYEYDQVKKLPRVVRYKGEVFVRTGWNSDNGQVYYRNNMPVAEEV
jgi:hypothetical protein